MGEYMEVDGIGRFDPDNFSGIAGGEGTVYIVNGLAVKIFHTPEELSAKIEKLKESMKKRNELWGRLSGYASPLKGFAYKNSQICGYSMEAFPGWKSIGEIACSAEECGGNIGTARSLELLIRLHKALSEAHKAGFVIADLNERNVLAAGNGKKTEIRLIDCDSYGVTIDGKEYPPDAIDHDICHPDQQKAIAEGGKVPFSQKYDWWAFTLLAASLLSGNNPYETGNYRLMPPQERLELRKSGWIFSTRNDRQTWINTMRFGSKIRAVFNYALTKNAEGAIPLQILVEAYNNIVRCGKCNLEFNREIIFCPNCARPIV